MREIVSVSTSAWDYVGTLHHPRHRRSGHRRIPSFVLFGSGHLPRDGHAGLSAGIADHLASLGYTVYRFDLPGLGDSPGDVPRTVDELFWMVHQGWFVTPATALLNELRRRYGHERFVLGGVCGAAVTSLLLADTHPSLVAGIVALEAEFFLPVPPRQLDPWEAVRSRASWLRILTGHSRYSWMIPFSTQPVLDRIGSLLLPSHTDRPLVRAWKRAAESRLPMLMIMAQGKRHALFYDQMRKAVISRRSCPNLVDVFVKGTNHVFTTGGARGVVIQQIGAWSQAVWPLTDPIDEGRTLEQRLPDRAECRAQEGSCAGRLHAVVLLPTGTAT